MNITNLKIDQKTIDSRVDENRFIPLQMAINDIVLNPDYPLDMPKIFECIQESLAKRKAIMSYFGGESKHLKFAMDALKAAQSALAASDSVVMPSRRNGEIKTIKLDIPRMKL